MTPNQKNIIENYDELQDGSFLILGQGRIVLDMSIYSRTKGDSYEFVHEVVIYKAKSEITEYMNFSHIDGISYKDYEELETRYFDTRSEVLELISEYLSETHF